MYKLWKFCQKHKWFKLGNALAYKQASQFRWKMLPPLVPPGLTNKTFQSFINGWFDIKYPLGWVHEEENPFVDSDSGNNNWDIKFDFVLPTTDDTKITVRLK